MLLHIFKLQVPEFPFVIVILFCNCNTIETEKSGFNLEFNPKSQNENILVKRFTGLENK